jgi:hypothetical protein
MPKKIQDSDQNLEPKNSVEMAERLNDENLNEFNLDAESLNEKPDFGMSIKISRDFKIKDSPKFNQAIADAHNKWLSENGFSQNENPEYFLDENPNLARFWYFFARKFDEILAEKDIPSSIVKTQFQTFAGVFRVLGNNFAPESKINPTTSDAHFESLWESELRDKILKIVEKSDEKSEKFLTRAVNILTKRGHRSIREKQETQFRQTLFRHAEKEMWRKSDAADVVRENWGKGWGEILDNLDLRTEKNLLEKQQQKYRDLKSKLENARDDSEKENLKNELSDLQLTIAENINEIIYSKKFWEPKDGQYSFRGLL